MDHEPLDERSWMTPPDPTHDAHSAWDTPDAPPRAPAAPPAPSSLPLPGTPYGAVPPPWYAPSGYWQSPAGSPPAWAPPPNSHLAWAIIVTLFCFMPFGIVAIVKASSVNPLWSQGRWAEAHAASASARLWSIGAMIMLPIMFIGFISFLVMVAVGRA